ncbi:hypothetical protein [Empedobacter brevis]|uniref:hypothetical protein n=1 Tax=Empedobacter brevis TaxID=247 RepID=UPI002FE0D779
MEKLNLNQENLIKLEEHFDELLPRLPFETVSFYESSNSWEGQIEYNLNLKTGEFTYHTIENIKQQLEISSEMMQRIESEIILMLENL